MGLAETLIPSFSLVFPRGHSNAEGATLSTLSRHECDTVDYNLVFSGGKIVFQRSHGELGHLGVFQSTKSLIVAESGYSSGLAMTSARARQ